MNTTPLGNLERCDLRKSGWNDEARHFTKWLAMPENLSRLSNALDLELELEGVEVRVGPYSADILAKDTSSDCRVVVENQLEKTNHDHLGKVLTYASGLDAKVLIWIAREFTEEHRRAIDYLNENTVGKLRLYAVEIQLFKIGDSLPAPYFNIVASPNEAYAAAAQVEGIGLTDTKALYLEFWNSFKDYCKSKGTSLSLRKARPQLWFSIAVGRSKFSLNLSASAKHKRLGCEIYMRGKNAKQAFKLLEHDKGAVEIETGPLEWQELPEGQDCRIALYKSDFDPTNKTDWPECFNWLKKEAELFHKVFSYRITELPIEDEPEDTEETTNGRSDV